MPKVAHGQVVILNGAPRSGKSSIVVAMQQSLPGDWLNLGADTLILHVIPPEMRPGIGLRPGGERPALEELVPALYAALYESIAAHSRLGFNVVADVTHHDAYSKPRGILPDCARRLAGLPVLFVGVRCPIETIMARREAGQPGRESSYLIGTSADPFPAPVRRWQEAVHEPGIYDLEVDTSRLSPRECATAIQHRLDSGPPGTAFTTLAALA